ncbi:hypothetical protein [Cutibacterium acnes]|uniref:hypothetical protein n=1 Tax=Cutibacterium acnes TaxID=1747 RepID=UPI000BF1CD57|nr:hypothetical protein [Cutibacterium acnes]PEN30194.1 hypothetical protein APS59_00195 [Cutibacterium acnes]
MCSGHFSSAAPRTGPVTAYVPALISRRPYPFSPQWVSLSVGELPTRGYFFRYVGSGATGVLGTFGG